MTVFTALTDTQIQSLLSRQQLTLVSSRPISEGIENSNYMLEARRANGIPVALVLTLFERLSAEQLPWFIRLTHALQARGLPVPAPLGGEAALMEMAGKPALLVPKLAGAHVRHASPGQLATLGRALATLHLSPLTTDGAPPGPEQQLQELVATHLPTLPEAARSRAGPLLERWWAAPATPVLCHGDLFRDNVLFSGARLTGLLDFYNAGFASAEYDLAITINDWCLGPQRQPNAALQRALLDGYQQLRPLDSAARRRLPLTLAIAALRFWLSRLESAAETPVFGPGRKDPAEFEQLFAIRAAAA